MPYHVGYITGEFSSWQQRQEEGMFINLHVFSILRVLHPGSGRDGRILPEVCGDHLPERGQEPGHPQPQHLLGHAAGPAGGHRGHRAGRHVTDV